MEDKADFFQAIQANGADDTARLVFADWLDEHDDPLGPFIRIQLKLHHMQPDDPQRRGLVREQNEMLRKHGEEWRQEQLPYAKLPLYIYKNYLTFTRGLLEPIGMDDSRLQAMKDCHHQISFEMLEIRERNAQMNNTPVADTPLPDLDSLLSHYLYNSLLPIDASMLRAMHQVTQTDVPSDIEPIVLSLTTLAQQGRANLTDPELIKAVIDLTGPTGLKKDESEMVKLIHDWRARRSISLDNREADEQTLCDGLEILRLASADINGQHRTYRPDRSYDTPLDRCNRMPNSQSAQWLKDHGGMTSRELQAKRGY